jgi:hypothetical protein
MTETKFFVFGSFCEGLVHFNKLQAFITESEWARTHGCAYRLKSGYPVFSDEGQDWVPGQLVSLKSSSSLLIPLLDEFHGVSHLDPKKSLHFRKAVTVTTDSGLQVEAQAYVVNPLKLSTSAQRVPNGDWLQSLKSNPPLVQSLTDRQREYIHRLGKATGREIVPIDLPLYRELMNLEIIVDKGRRLALSKFGHEVFRYLN